MMFGFKVVVVVSMLLINAVLAAYEMALASISRARIFLLVEEQGKTMHVQVARPYSTE